MGFGRPPRRCRGQAPALVSMPNDFPVGSVEIQVVHVFSCPVEIKSCTEDERERPLSGRTRSLIQLACFRTFFRSGLKALSASVSSLITSRLLARVRFVSRLRRVFCVVTRLIFLVRLTTLFFVLSTDIGRCLSSCLIHPQ